MVEIGEQAVKVSEPLFSKKNKKLMTNPLDDDNPITVQVLGICSALAITVQVKQAVVMSLSVLVVLVLGNVIVSLLRNIIPNRIRNLLFYFFTSSFSISTDQESGRCSCNCKTRN